MVARQFLLGRPCGPADSRTRVSVRQRDDNLFG